MAKTIQGNEINLDRIKGLIFVWDRRLTRLLQFQLPLEEKVMAQAETFGSL